MGPAKANWGYKVAPGQPLYLRPLVVTAGKKVLDDTAATVPERPLKSTVGMMLISIKIYMRCRCPSQDLFACGHDEVRGPPDPNSEHGALKKLRSVRWGGKATL